MWKFWSWLKKTWGDVKPAGDVQMPDGTFVKAKPPAEIDGDKYNSINKDGVKEATDLTDDGGDVTLK